VEEASCAKALDSFEKTARREDTARIENGFEFLHQRKVGTVRAPEIERGFPFVGAPRNCGVAAELRAIGVNAIRHIGDAFHGFLVACRRQNREVDHADAARHGDPWLRMIFGRVLCGGECVLEMFGQHGHFYDRAGRRSFECDRREFAQPREDGAQDDHFGFTARAADSREGGCAAPLGELAEIAFAAIEDGVGAFEGCGERPFSR